jgi:hypothetical protein
VLVRVLAPYSTSRQSFTTPSEGVIVTRLVVRGHCAELVPSESTAVTTGLTKGVVSQRIIIFLEERKGNRGKLEGGMRGE